MAVFKCEVCGANLNVPEGVSVVECEYCGTKQTVEANLANPSSALLRRGNILLEDGDYEHAENCFEKALETMPECAEAYLGKFLAKQKIYDRKILPKLRYSYNEDPDFKKALLFGSEELKKELQGYVESSEEKKKAEELKASYGLAEADLAKGSLRGFRKAKERFFELGDYKESKEKLALCEEGIKKFEEKAKERAERLQKYNGQRIFLGNYREKKLEWIVLDETEYGVLLLAKEGIGPYTPDEKDCETIWETSEVRRFLNGDFFNQAFFKPDVLSIKSTIIKTKSNSHEPLTENLSEDKVFLLSSEEAEEYLWEDSNRTIPSSAVYNENSTWLLRTNVYSNFSKKTNYAYVDKAGHVCDAMFLAHDLELRPAVWVESGFLEMQKYWNDLVEKDRNNLNKYLNSIGNYKGYGIDWMIIDRRVNDLLVVSKDVIETMPINNTYAKVTWDNCDLRKWLNGYFYENVFTPEEKNCILTAHLSNNDRKFNEKPLSGGSDTEDKVFLLSMEQLKSCVVPEELCHCSGSSKPYIGQIHGDPKTNEHHWWLRSKGLAEDQFGVCGPESPLGDGGVRLEARIIGVRPAMLMDLEKCLGLIGKRKQERKNALQISIFYNNEKIKNLNTERSKLGIFGGQRKKEIDAEIENIKAQNTELEKAIAQI